MGTMARAAWTRGRAGQPVVSYVGYSLKEPWGEPRVVIGIDEAEYLAEFLDRDECAQRGQQVLPQQAQRPQAPIQAPANTRVRRFWARQYPSAAAASQRIRPGIWPAGPRVSFPAR